MANQDDPSEISASVLAGLRDLIANAYEELGRLDEIELSKAADHAADECRGVIAKLKTEVDYLRDALDAQAAREQRQAERDMADDLASAGSVGLCR
jgi:hypothetical protein